MCVKGPTHSVFLSSFCKYVTIGFPGERSILRKFCTRLSVQSKNSLKRGAQNFCTFLEAGLCDNVVEMGDHLCNLWLNLSFDKTPANMPPVSPYIRVVLRISPLLFFSQSYTGGC